MTRLEQIIFHAQKLPDSLQQEVLDFVEYLEIKNLSQADLSEKEWSELSVSSALSSINEESAEYTVKDIKEKFK